MKKLLIFLLLFGALMVFVTPGVVGFVAARFYPMVISAVSDGNPNVDISIREFDRGWFGSNADLTIRLTSPAVVNWLAAFAIPAPEFELQDQLNHGLFSPSSQGWAPFLIAGGGKYQQTSGQLTGDLSYRVGLDRTTQVGLTLAPVDAEGPMGFWRTNGTEFSAQINESQDVFSISLAQETLSLLGPGADIDLGYAALRLDWAEGEGALAGDARGVRQGDLRIGDGRLEASVERRDRWIELMASLNDEAFGLGDEDYGALASKIAVTQIEARGIDAIFARITGPAKSPEQRRAAILGEAISQAPMLLATRPRVDVESLTLDGPFGRAEASGHVLLEPPDPQALREPMQLIQHLDADLRADVPERLAHSLMRYRIDENTDNRLESDALDMAAERALQRFRGEGLFVLNNGVYQMRAQRSQGVTTINGQRLALPDG